MLKIALPPLGARDLSSTIRAEILADPPAARALPGGKGKRFCDGVEAGAIFGMNHGDNLVNTLGVFARNAKDNGVNDSR
jgi:hypothetical protein